MNFNETNPPPTARNLQNPWELSLEPFTPPDSLCKHTSHSQSRFFITQGATSVLVHLPGLSISMDLLLSPTEKLFHTRGVPHTLPDDDHITRLSRRGSLQDACLAPQTHPCAIPERTDVMSKLETAHPVPHSIAAISTAADPPYWRFLRLILGSHSPTTSSKLSAGHTLLPLHERADPGS